MTAKGLALGGMLVCLAGCPQTPEAPDRDAPFHDYDGDGYSEDEGDCDDGDAAVSPDGVEVCNEVDDDCDDAVDEDGEDGPLWYLDADGDGFGDLSDPGVRACVNPGGRVADHTDCDDRADGGADTWPGNPNPTPGDGDDDDCDPAGRDECHVDADGDGHGVATIVQDSGDGGCLPAEQESAIADDCAPDDASIHPAAPEICDEIDQDCDLVIDEGTIGLQACPASNCREVRDLLDDPSSGTYWVDPAGTGAFQVYCDMDADGGGWTLLARVRYNATEHRTALALGTLEAPDQTTTAKLADDVIDDLRGEHTTSVLRLSCGDVTTFFSQDLPFQADGDDQAAITTCSASADGPFDLALPWPGHYGLNSLQSNPTTCPYAIYQYADKQGCYILGNTSSDGTLWVR